MTPVLRLIKTELDKGETEFNVPVWKLEDADLELIERGILKYKGEFLKSAPCPECGTPAQITRESQGEKDTTFAYCTDCGHLGRLEIEPSRVDLLRFNYRKFRLFVNDPDSEGEYADAAARCMSPNAADGQFLNDDRPPSCIKDDLRLTAVGLMKRYHKVHNCSLTEAEEKVHAVMWKEFHQNGLASDINNFHALRYNEKYRDAPESDDATMKKYRLPIKSNFKAQSK